VPDDISTSELPAGRFDLNEFRHVVVRPVDAPFVLAHALYIMVCSRFIVLGVARIGRFELKNRNSFSCRLSFVIMTFSPPQRQTGRIRHSATMIDATGMTTAANRCSGVAAGKGTPEVGLPKTSVVPVEPVVPVVSVVPVEPVGPVGPRRWSFF
jgi:hypothetical protein